MKNYVDENHDAYKDANKEFYHYYCEFDWGKLNQKLKPYDERRRQLNRTAYERNVLGKHDQDTSSDSYWPDGKVMPLWNFRKKIRFLFKKFIYVDIKK